MIDYDEFGIEMRVSRRIIRLLFKYVFKSFWYPEQEISIYLVDLIKQSGLCFRKHLYYLRHLYPYSINWNHSEHEGWL